MNLIKLLKDIIAPKKCYSCKKEGHFLCKDCYNKIENYSENCYICKKESKNYNVCHDCRQSVYYDKIIIDKHYKNYIIKKLITDCKFYNKKDILEDLSYFLGKKLLRNIGDSYIKKSDIILIPVPMYFFKKLKRGYNVTEILSKQISKNIGLSYSDNIIYKVINTSQQSKLNLDNRKKNVANAFKIKGKNLDKVDKKLFIIVDDVVSSGSTINEIAKLLKDNGVKNIIGLTIASD